MFCLSYAHVLPKISPDHAVNLFERRKKGKKKRVTWNGVQHMMLYGMSEKSELSDLITKSSRVILTCQMYQHVRVFVYSLRLTLDTRGNPSHVIRIAPDRAMINGCSTFTPLACASTPTAKGRIAAPLPPKAATNPIEVTCRCRGRSFVIITTAPGKRGPERSLAKTLPRPMHKIGAQAIEPKQIPWSKLCKPGGNQSRYIARQRDAHRNCDFLADPGRHKP